MTATTTSTSFRPTAVIRVINPKGPTNPKVSTFISVYVAKVVNPLTTHPGEPRTAGSDW